MDIKLNQLLRIKRRDRATLTLSFVGHTLFRFALYSTAMTATIYLLYTFMRFIIESNPHTLSIILIGTTSAICLIESTYRNLSSKGASRGTKDDK